MTTAVTRLLLASRNRAKLVELRRILAATRAGGQVELVGPDDVPDYPEVPETGLTFAENALIKAREGALRTGLPTVADDSGLTVDALHGMPGVFSARWCGRHGDDDANLRLVLAVISDVPDEYRAGAFVCAAALVWPDGREQVVEGKVTGHIIRSPRGTGGFGYDPIFVPDGHTRTTAELTPADKDAISHRGKAFRALADLLAAELS
jgi:XTP/dITP diphosphohydrolase